MIASGLLAAALAAAPARAQAPDTVTVITPTAPADEEREFPDFTPATTPGGAFLRAVILPGWGHAAIGAYTRGGFYFAAETATAWMMLRTAQRLGAAKDLRFLREQAVREQLTARGVTEDSLVVAAIDADDTVGDARSLVRARRQQFQDWFALGIFLAFLSGADAFVSAHLANFPEPITLGATPLPGGGAVIGVSVPVGRPRR